MLFTGKEKPEQIIRIISDDSDAFENIVAMANIGAAFTQICILEDSVSSLVLISKVTLQKKLDSAALSETDLFMQRMEDVGTSTLGQLVTAIEKSGMTGRDIRYLRTIVRLRNDFVHRFLRQVPLPGDWQRYGFDLERFSEYTAYVTKHVWMAGRLFPRIMFKHGLVGGTFGDFGSILWHPDFPFDE